MAKLKAATQTGYFVGRVVSGSIKEQKFKSGSSATVYHISVLTSDGVFFNVERKLFKPVEEMHPFVQEQIADLTAIITAVNEPTYKDSKEDHIYVGKYIKPGKDGTMAFDKIRTWTDKNGMLKFTVEGGVNRVKTSINEEGDVVLHYENKEKGTSRTELFKEKKTTFTLKMVVAKTIEKGANKEDWQVVLSDGKAQFPLEVIAKLGDVAKHGFPPVGVGVEANVEIRRGQRGAVERGTAAYGQNTGTKSTGGTSDAVWITSIPSMVQELTLEGGASAGGIGAPSTGAPTMGGAPAPGALF